MIQAIQSQLELEPWKVVNDTSVNPVPLDSYFPETVNQELEIFSVSSKPYGGALAHCTQAVPLFGGSFLTPYVKFSAQVKIPAAASGLMRCLEIDLKGSMTAAPSGGTAQNCFDGSTQIELFNGGNLQIDQNGTWADTGFKVGALPVDTWFPWACYYFVDSANLQLSVLRFAIAGQEYTIPATMQKQPWLTTNWGQAVEPALQCDDNTAPGAFVVDYQGIVIEWRDQPIP